MKVPDRHFKLRAFLEWTQRHHDAALKELTLLPEASRYMRGFWSGYVAASEEAVKVLAQLLPPPPRPRRRPGRPRKRVSVVVPMGARATAGKR